MTNEGPAPTYRSGDQSVPASGAVATPEERAAALDFLRDLASEVSQGIVDLPCFPDVVVRISRALADPETTAEQTVTIVGAEPRLAARLLQTANSATFNVSGKPVTDLRSAITRLGHQTVQSTAMSYALQQMQHEATLRAIAQPLAQLWEKSIAVASLCHLVAARTAVNPDEAFLAGLLHGIGSLYIMVRAVGRRSTLSENQSCMDLVAGWQSSIGKAVLESWGFPEEMCDAVRDQGDHTRKWKHQPELTDVMIAGIVLADALRNPEPRSVETDGINSFQTIRLTEQDCAAILTDAERRIRLVRDALGC